MANDEIVLRGVQPQTIETYDPTGEFVGFLAPGAHRKYIEMLRRGNGSDSLAALTTAADAGLAAYSVMAISQLDSDFHAARRAARSRKLKQAAVLEAARKVAPGGDALATALESYFKSGDDLAHYQNRVTDGQLKFFWAEALASGVRTVGDLLGPGVGQDSPVGGWIVAGAGGYLLATLFDGRNDRSDRSDR